MRSMYSSEVTKCQTLIYHPTRRSIMFPELHWNLAVLKNWKFALSTNKKSTCSAFYSVQCAWDDMHSIPCIVFHACSYMHLFLCFLLYASCSMFHVLDNVFYALCSILSWMVCNALKNILWRACVVCIVLYYYFWVV